ncbi:MAG TPA: phosphoglucosamine mutase [bacterium]|nr:phosphoglucosamine mutase [bacterium]
MKRHLFGTDGIRGTAGLDPVTPEVFFSLGKAAAHYFGKGKPRPRLLIGRDTRESGRALDNALAAGFAAGGGEALKAGVLPTPAIAVLTRRYKAQAGAVLSASHNPFEDNGLKFFSPAGEKLTDAQEAELESLLAPSALERARHPLGVVRDLPEAAEAYRHFVLSTVPKGMTLKGMKLVVDCGHGASGVSTPEVLRRLGATVHVLHNEPDGRNINRASGSTHPQALLKAVRRLRAHAGLAHDGDADRVLMADEKGRLVDGDRMMGLCALHMAAHGGLPRRLLVATVMSNLGFEKALGVRGITVLRAAVGDRYVLAMMKERGAVLGGEQSGHVIFSRLLPTGDGLVTALQVLSVMRRERKSLSELAGFFTEVPQLLVNVKVAGRADLAGIEPVAGAMAAAELELEGQGRVLVRWSGTEPKVRVMVEGPSLPQVERLAHGIAREIQKALG